jgi:hypothetical protein
MGGRTRSTLERNPRSHPRAARFKLGRRDPKERRFDVVMRDRDTRGAPDLILCVMIAEAGRMIGDRKDRRNSHHRQTMPRFSRPEFRS